MTKKALIAPSLLAADFTQLGTEVDQVIAAGADFIHLDVMDNHYVPNLTFGPIICQSIANKNLSVPIDAHLMVQPVDNTITAFAKAGATYITIHPEATGHLHRSIQLIKDAGCKVGVALNPASPLSSVELVIDEIDLLLIMSVNPGFGGQAFIANSLEKITAARQLLNKHKSKAYLQVDGGVTVDNIADVINAGADVIVAGSAIFNTQDYRKTIADMHQAYTN